MFDHVAIKTSHLKNSTAFYKAVLAPFGYTNVEEFDGGTGFTGKDKTTLYLGAGRSVDKHVHLAFAAPKHASIRHLERRGFN